MRSRRASPRIGPGPNGQPPPSAPAASSNPRRDSTLGSSPFTASSRSCCSSSCAAWRTSSSSRTRSITSRSASRTSGGSSCPGRGATSTTGTAGSSSATGRASPSSSTSTSCARSSAGSTCGSAATTGRRATGTSPTSDQLEQIAHASVVQRYLDQVNALLGRFGTVDSGRLRSHLHRQLLLPYTLVDDLKPEEFARLIEHLPVNSPLQVYTSTTRSYPYGAAAAHVLGYVGANEGADDEEFPGEGLTTLKMKGTVGRDGLEKQFDSLLQGEAGYTILRVDPAGYKVNPPIEHRLPGPGPQPHVEPRHRPADRRRGRDRRRDRRGGRHGRAHGRGPRDGDQAGLRPQRVLAAPERRSGGRHRGAQGLDEHRPERRLLAWLHVQDRGGDGGAPERARSRPRTSPRTARGP